MTNINTGEKTQLRALAVGDHAAWVPLWQDYQAFYRVEIPPAATARTWERMLDPSEPVHGAAALQAGRLCGIVHWLFHRSTWAVSDACYLQDLFVTPEARGQGVGRALIEHVYDAAQRAGCAEVYWVTHETNRAAMTLYDRIADRTGFVHYGKTLA